MFSDMSITMVSLGVHSFPEYVAALAHEIGHALDYKAGLGNKAEHERFLLGAMAYTRMAKGEISSMTREQFDALICNEEQAWINAMNMLHGMNIPHSFWETFFAMKAIAIKNYLTIPHT